MDKIKTVTPKEHINININMYAGNTNYKNINIYNYEKNKTQRFYFNQGIMKCIEEIFDNIEDNFKKENIKKELRIRQKENEITITNHSNIIVYGLLDGENQCIAKKLISEPFSSTKFDKQSDTIGINGVGIKILPILCGYLKITICDGINSYIYETIRKDEDKSKIKKEDNFQYNILTDKLFSEKLKSEIWDDLDSFFEIKFIPSSFLLNLDRDYKDNMIDYLLPKIYELKIYGDILNQNRIIIFNNKEILTNYNFNTFINNFLGNNRIIIKNQICELIGKDSKTDKTNIMIDIYLSISKEKKRMTVINGKFLNKYLIEGTKESFLNLFKKYNIENDKVIDLLNIFMIVKNEKFSFNGQQKKNIVGNIKFNITDKIPEEFILELKKLTNTNNFKKIKINNLKHFYPSYIKKDISLIIIEGDSALTAVRRGNDKSIKSLKQSIDCFDKECSYFAVIGKINNVLKNNNDNEITNTLYNIGLLEKKEINKHKEILIFADADHDGTHIVCLILLWLYKNNRDLLDIVKIPNLPIISCCSKLLLDDNELEIHKKNKGNHNPKYLKGLASYDPKTHIKYIIENRNNYFFKIDYNKDDLEYFDKLFNVNSDTRKKLFNLKKEEFKIIRKNNCNYVNLKNYLNSKYKEFLDYSNERTIQSLQDGFNISGRKMLQKIITEYKDKESKIVEISSSIIKDLEYHHGDSSISSVIVRYGNCYDTGINIPLVQINGSIGSRQKNGKDHGAYRYITGKAYYLTKYIFREEDNIILEYLKGESKEKIEPKIFYPIVPLNIINGSINLGTGFSSFIPSFNIKDVINNILLFLNNKEFKFDQPYVRKYKGVLRIIKKDKSLYLFITGKYNIDKKEIYEIPYIISIQNFVERLKNKGYEFKYGENNSIDEIDIIITKFPKTEINILEEDMDEDELNIRNKLIKDNNDIFKMLSVIKKVNITTFDTINKEIKTFDTIEELFIEFCKFRLKMYELRKSKTIEKLKFDLTDIIIKKKLYEILLHNKIPKDKEAQEILFKNSLSEFDIERCRKIFNNLKVCDITVEKLNGLEKDIFNKRNYIKKYKCVSCRKMWISELKELNENLESSLY